MATWGQRTPYLFSNRCLSMYRSRDVVTVIDFRAGTEWRTRGRSRGCLGHRSCQGWRGVVRKAQRGIIEVKEPGASSLSSIS